MSDPSSGLEVSETVPGSKRLDSGVFLKIGRAGILDIMVEGGDDLLWGMNLRGSPVGI